MADKGITILATGIDWQLCPFDGEVWSINGGYKVKDRVEGAHVDRLFLADKLYTEYSSPNFDVDEMNSLGIPIVSVNHIEGLNYEPYPFKEISRHFETDYFANSICYLIAYALYHGIKNFRCYGFQFQTPREVIEQKPCLEYWLGRAEGMGGKVNIHGVTTLMKHFRGFPYGFREDEYGYITDESGALEKWHEIVEKHHWDLFPRWEDLLKENDTI